MPPSHYFCKHSGYYLKFGVLSAPERTRRRVPLRACALAIRGRVNAARLGERRDGGRRNVGLGDDSHDFRSLPSGQTARGPFRLAVP